MKKPVAFITGASRGIGRGVAIELARQGWDLAGLSRVFDPNNVANGLFEVKQRAENAGAGFLPIQGDVTSLADHGHILELILEKYGRIDLLVNNAGVTPEKQLDTLEATGGSFDRVLNINLRGPFFLTQRVALQMIGQKKESSGRQPAIVFITSILARIPTPSQAEYCISKAGLSMAAAVFADRLKEHGIRVHEVRPEVAGAASTEESPPRSGRLPENVGEAVAALVSGSSACPTGAVIEISGNKLPGS